VQTAVDAEGNTTAYTYDQNDNVETVTDALGTKTKTAYDAEDRATTVTEADGTDVARTRAILSRGPAWAMPSK